MRVVHISDLHAGKTLERISRNEDLNYALEQVLSFIKENDANLLLIAGDVFDKANPDNESKELIFDFFLKLKDLNVPAVVISGNHDSYDFMKSIKNILRLANVFICDRPGKGDFVFVFNDLAVACLPYPSEKVLTEIGEEAKKNYAEAVKRYISFLAKQVEKYRYRVLLAHLFVAGARYTNTEKEATLTEHYAVYPSALLETFNYVALGHVHRNQEVKNSPARAFYAGSMYQLDFSEEGHEKFFNFVIFEGNIPKIERIKLSLKNPLKVFKFKQRDAEKFLPEMKKHNGYIKVVMEVENKLLVNQTVERIRRECGEKIIKIEQVSDITKTLPKEESVENLSPLEIYKEYYRLTYRRELPEEIEKAFLELLERVE